MILTTTGTQATVVITGLRNLNNNDLTLTHPQTINLLDFYDNEDIQGVASSIQAALDANTLIAQTEDGEPILNVQEATSGISNLHPVSFSGDYNDLNNIPTIPSAPVDSVNGQTGTVIINASDVGLGNVDNTSDANKPVSNAQQTALDGKVDDSQVLTNVPAGAVFTDTVYDDTNLQNSVNTNTANIAVNTSKVSFPEAPTDGQQYARQNQSWSVVTGGSGGANVLNDLNDVNTSSGQTGDILIRDSSGIYNSQSVENGFTIFPIWAEENAQIDNGQYEWSYGNGSTGDSIGITLPIDCELFASTLNAESFSTSASINIYRRRGEINTLVSTPNFTNRNQSIDETTPIQFLAGDTVVIQTNTVVGFASDVRICNWFRVISQTNLPKTDRSRSLNSNVTFNANTFFTIPGMTATVTLTKPGEVEADFVYGGQRAGTANSEIEFRINIDGVTGGNLQETLSTFKDTGVVSFFRENLPAGTYTVSVEALTSDAVFFNNIKLKAEANED